MKDGGAKAKRSARLNDCLNYLHSNRAFIVNYGDGFRHGDPVAAGFVESAVNRVVAKRFGKRQQMSLADQNAHCLL